MLERTSRRLAGVAYQRRMARGSPSAPFTTIISAPRAGSFAVTVELAPRSDQPQSLFVSGEDVIDQVVDGVRAVQNQELGELRSRIADERYYVNFVSLAQQLAPDGEKVTMVGLTSSKGAVSFTKPKTTIEVPTVREVVGPVADQNDLSTTVRGVLDEASARGSEKVGLTTTDGRTFDLSVREGMDDIVRNHFNRQVEVRVRGRKGSTELVSVVAVED